MTTPDEPGRAGGPVRPRAWAWLLGCAIRVLLVLAAFGLAVPASAFIFDTYGDGFWTVINQANGNTLVVNANGASQALAGTTAAQQQFELLYNLQNGTFRLRNRDSWLCIGALNGATTNGTAIVTVPNYTGASWQQWNFQDVGSGNFRIVNAASGLALQTDNRTPATVTLAPPSTSTRQYWHFAYQTHYPKKGTAGYESDWAKFGSSWCYNWGRDTGASLPAQVVFEPMQWGPWWPDLSTLSQSYAAWHATPKPVYILGFNEPDHTDQANMTTASAISLWPQLQAMNVPLVSPACANAFGGWLGDFYNQIASQGYRVDFTAVHWYANPSASGLLGQLQSVYNTWGRAVWLTEFSTVDWAGTATWTEQDNYRFLAEFLWQAEDLVWLKRYSIFSFSGTPSVNPWDANGHRGDVFLADGSTFTPFGELYAAWDADRTLEARTNYFIQNLATCFRLTSTPGVSGPAASSLRHGDAATQWALLSAPTAGHWYIVSLRDGRRLRDTAGVLDLAPPGAVGSALEWSFNGPDSTGYYFIDNPAAGQSLSGAGTPPGIGWSLVAAGSPSDNTRWRLVKPYQPVTLSPAVAPSNLVAATADRSVTLRWSGSAPRYSVYRGTVTGGPYTRIVADITRPLFIDCTVQNGVPYYYVVTALDGLEGETAYSAEASAMAASGLGLGLVAEYKFENTAQDSSGNGFHGTLNGATSFGAGRVDAAAINFTGGDNCYVEIPNPLGNDFSIAFWVMTSATAATGQWWSGQGLVDGEVPGQTNDFGVALVGNKAAFGIGNPDTTITSSTAINDGLWHHVVAARNSTTGSMLLYVDGVLRAAGAGPTGTRATPTVLRIGGLQSGWNFFNGAIDEVRLYNYALSASEVKTLANLGATLVANYRFGGNVLDSSGLANNGAATGVTYVTGKANPQAAQFDGVSSFVQIPASVAADFSIAFWVKTMATGGAGQWWNGKGLVDGEVPGSVADFGTALVGAKAGFGVGNPDATITSLTAINDGQWHHVAATRNNGRGAMRLYLDGVQQAATTGPTGTRSALPALRLGGIQSGGGFLAGTLDDVRLYNYELHPSQVAALFNPQPLPAPWQDADSGSPGSAGYANYASATGAWTLGGSGSDIWLTSDQFHFAWQALSGPGSIVARVTAGAVNSDGSTNQYAKSGLMFRDSAAPNAPFVGLFHAQSAGLQMIYRDSASATAGQFPTVAVNPPVWLRLVRRGNVFAGYYATNALFPSASDWVLVGTRSPAIGNTALAGLVACSRDNTKLASASYTGVVVSPPTPPAISTVPDQVIHENTATAVLPVTISDAQTVSSNLMLTASSSDVVLAPLANIVLGGSGSNRTVQVTPAAFQSGAATISLIVNNGQPIAATATNSFLLTVLTTPAGAWRQQWFGTTANAGDAADTADPNHNGIINVLERAFNLNPIGVDTNGWPVANPPGSTFTLTYRKSVAAVDLGFQVVWSRDLMHWSTNQITDTLVSSDGATEIHAASLPLTAGTPLFLRLDVTAP